MTIQFTDFWCILLGICIFLDSSKAATNTTAENADDELIFAQVVFRHGNRTITRTYENDPYKSDDYWPEGYSELTKAGMQAQYELGLFLRRRYGKLIGPGYSPDKVYIRSSDTDRTMQSALCNAAGLFQPSREQVWDESLNWQPIPIHTIPLDEDYLLYQSIPCDKIDKLYREHQESPQMMNLVQRFNEFREFLMKHSGSSIKIVEDFILFYEVLTIENFQGMPLPKWAEMALKSSDGALEYLAGRSFETWSLTPEMRKAKTGFLIKEMFERFRNKTLKRLVPDRSLWIYSGHDNTIINLLKSFNVFKPHVPTFAASLHFELYKNGNEHYVQIFYRSDKVEDIPALNIPGCGVRCPLDKLFELIDDILPSDDDTYQSLCRV